MFMLRYAGVMGQVYQCGFTEDEIVAIIKALRLVCENGNTSEPSLEREICEYLQIGVLERTV